MKKVSFKKLLAVNFLLLLPLYESQAALVTTQTFSDTVDLSYLTSGAPDTYGITSATAGSSISVQISYDNDPANASFMGENSYHFDVAPYGGTLTIDGTTINSNRSSVAIIDNYSIVPADIEPIWNDMGLVAPAGTEMDALFINMYSDDFQWGDGFDSGLQVTLGFIDLSGSLFSDFTIPSTTPSLNDIDLAVILVEQLDQGTHEYIAASVLANNIAPVPVPAAAWLFVSGIIGLFGMAKRKNI